VGPGAPILAVKAPIGLCYGLGLQAAERAARPVVSGEILLCVIAVDHAVDDDMRDVNAFRTEFSRQRLCDATQGGLGRGESEKRRAGAQGGGRAGEQERAATERLQALRRFASDEEAAERILPPQSFEIFRRGFQRRGGAIAANASFNLICIKYCHKGRPDRQRRCENAGVARCRESGDPPPRPNRPQFTRKELKRAVGNEGHPFSLAVRARVPARSSMLKIVRFPLLLIVQP